jgi:polygalacturonase
LTITNCEVSGFENGTFLDGGYKRSEPPPERNGPTGRIKIGTESEGSFRNITISNCVFDYSRGLALETVDGAELEDVSITNLTMRDISNAPIDVRLGQRMRAPEGTPIGALRRVNISNVVVYNADPRYGSMILGTPGHNIEDLKLSHTTRRPSATGAAAFPSLRDDSSSASPTNLVIVRKLLILRCWRERDSDRRGSFRFAKLQILGCSTCRYCH